MYIRRSMFVHAILLALVLAGCGTPPEAPADGLEDALKRTFSGSFDYRVTVELGDAALAELRTTDPQLATGLQTLEVRGTYDDPSHSLVVSALGLEIFELRKVDATRTFTRIDLGAIAGLSGAPFDPTAVVDEFMMYGVGEKQPELRDVLERLVRGDWVGFDVDAERLAAAMESWASDDHHVPFPLSPFAGTGDGEGLFRAVEEHVANSPGEFIERFTSVSERTADDVRHLSVDLRLRTLLTAMTTALAEVWAPFAYMGDEIEGDLAAVPEIVSGLSIDVRDRLVQRIAFDLFEAMRSADVDDVPPGSASLVVEFTEHGSATSAVAPEGVAPVDLVDLLEGFVAAMPASYADVIEGDLGEGAVDQVPEGRSGQVIEPGWGDDLHSLAVAQEAHFGTHGSYNDDVSELLQYGFHPFEGRRYGTCVFDDDTGFVVAASGPDGDVYIDSGRGVVTPDTANMACEPELVEVATG